MSRFIKGSRSLMLEVQDTAMQRMLDRLQTVPFQARLAMPESSINMLWVSIPCAFSTFSLGITDLHQSIGK